MDRQLMIDCARCFPIDPLLCDAVRCVAVRCVGRNGDLFAATADSRGNWITYLPPQQAAWNRTLTISSTSGSSGSGSSSSSSSNNVRSETLSIPVSFGETVLCAGQSNMGMQVGPSVRGFDADNATAENAASVLYTGKIVLHSRLSRWTAARGINQNSTVWYVLHVHRTLILSACTMPSTQGLCTTNQQHVCLLRCWF